MLEENNIEICKEWNEEEVGIVREGIIGYNKGLNPAYPRVEPVNLILKEKGQVIGGLSGKIYLLGVTIDILWIDDNYRKLGFGYRLLSEIEEIGRAKGCKFIHLDTFSFQAPDFYKKCGFKVFGVLEGYPEGISRYYLKKDI